MTNREWYDHAKGIVELGQHGIAGTVITVQMALQKTYAEAFAAGAAAMRERCIKECVGEAAYWRAEWLKAGQPEGSVGDKELAIEDCITGIKALPVPTPGDR